MTKKFVLVGKSCSGKTELAMLLKNKGLKAAVTCTSRPIRPSELDGVHYYFKTVEEFKQMITDDELVEYDVFNNWYYGLPKEEFINSEVLVVTPRGVKKLVEKFGRDAMSIIYLDTSAAQRLVRSSYRGDDMKEVERRFITDEEDFAEFHATEDWDLRIDLRIEDNYELLLKLFS